MIKTLKTSTTSHTSQNYAKVRIIRGTKSAKLKEASIYIELEHGNKGNHCLNTELIPLPCQQIKPFAKNKSKELRFDMPANAGLAIRRNIDKLRVAKTTTKLVTTILSGNGDGAGKKITINIPTSSGECQFALAPDGNVELIHMPSDLDLSLETFGKIKTLQNIRCRKLKVVAKQFENAYNLNSELVALNCAEKIINNGSISSKDLAIQGKVLENFEQGAILCLQANIRIANKLENHGNIGVNEKSSNLIIVTPQLINGEKGVINGAGSLRLYTGEILDNAGKILANHEIESLTKDLITHPNSVINSDNLVYINCHGAAYVQGTIKSESLLHIKALSLKNDNGIDGSLGSNGFVQIEVEETLDNSGKIIGKNLITLNGQNFNNHGLIQTPGNLQVDVGAALINQGTIDANNIHSVQQNLQNYGLVTANTCELRTKNLFENTTTGVIQGTQNFTIECQNSINQGTMTSKSFQIIPESEHLTQNTNITNKLQPIFDSSYQMQLRSQAEVEINFDIDKQQLIIRSIDRHKLFYKEIYFRVDQDLSLPEINLRLKITNKTLLVTEQPQVGSDHAASHNYIINANCKIILADLSVNSLIVNSNGVVDYQPKVVVKENLQINCKQLAGSRDGKIVAKNVQINSQQFKAGENSIIIAKQNLIINSQHINNSKATLQGSSIKIIGKTLINEQGKVLGNHGSIEVTILDNHQGIINASIIESNGLDVDSIMAYVLNQPCCQNDLVTLQIKATKLLNTGGGLIVSQNKLLIEGKKYNFAQDLSLFMAMSQKHPGLINQGLIASLDNQININGGNCFYNIFNFKDGIVLAKDEVIISSLGKIFRTPDSKILGSKICISGLQVDLNNIQADDLNLQAYRRVMIDNSAIKYYLAVKVINGDCSYRGINCGEADFIHQQGELTLGTLLTSKELRVNGSKLIIDSEINAETCKVNAKYIHHSAGKIEINTAKFTANDFDSMGELAAQDLTVKAHNFTTNKITAHTLTVAVTGRFIYTPNLLQADNYDLTVHELKDLFLPSKIAGNYKAQITSDFKEAFRLLYNVQCKGFFDLELKQFFELGEPGNYTQILSSSYQTIKSLSIEILNGAILSQGEVTLDGKEKLDIGRMVTSGQTPSNISCLGKLNLICSSAAINNNSSDIYTADLLTVKSPISFINTSGTIDCKDALMDTPYSLHQMPYVNKAAGTVPISESGSSVLGIYNHKDSHGHRIRHLGSVIATGSPAWMFVNGTSTSTGSTNNIASKLFCGQFNGAIFPTQSNIHEYHSWYWGLYCGHKKSRKRNWYEGTRTTQNKVYIATNVCLKDQQLSMKTVPKALQEGVFITAGGVQLSIASMQIGTLQNVNLNIVQQAFQVINSLSALYDRPNALHEIVKKSINPHTVFQCKLPLDYGLHHGLPPIPIVVVTATGFRLEARNLRKLYNELQESQLIMKGLVQQLGHSILGEGDNKSQLQKFLLTNAHEFFIQESTKTKAITWNNLELIAGSDNKLVNPILIYKEQEFIHDDGEIETILVPFLVIPPSCYDPDLTSGAGGIWAKFIKIIGDHNSSLRLTGFFKAKQDIHLTVDELEIVKRQYTEEVCVTTVEKSRSGFKSKEHVSHHRVTTKQSQPGGSIESNKITVNCQNLNTRGAILRSSAGDTAIHAAVINDCPNIDVELADISVSRRSALQSKSITTQQARHSVVPTIVQSTGGIGIKADFTAKFVATNFKAKFIHIVAEKFLKLEPAIVHEEISPIISKKGQALFTTVGYMDRGVPVILDSEEGVHLESKANLELHAPLIRTNNLKIIAREVLLAAVKLKTELRTKGKGLTNWKNYITKYSEYLLQENALFPMIQGDFIEILATEGSAILESMNISSNYLNNDAVCKISAYVDVIFKSMQLRQERHVEQSGISINVAGPALLEAALKESINPIINSIPLLASIKNLSNAKSEGEIVGHGLMTAYQLYDVYKQYKSGDLLTNLRDQLISVSASLKLEHKRSKTINHIPALGLIKTGKLLLSAGRNIELHGINADLQQFFAECEDLQVNAVAAISQQQEISSSARVGAGLSFSGLTLNCGIAGSSTKNEASQHIPSIINAQHFTALIRENAEFRGVVINAADVFMDIGNRLLIETLQDEIKLTRSGYHVNIGYDPKSGSLISGLGLGCSVSQALQNKKWVDVKSGIKASNTLSIKVGNVATIKGAIIAVGKDATPVKVQTSDGIANWYEFKMPPDNDCAFHALGIPRKVAVQQLLENCKRAEIAKLIASEFYCAMYDEECAMYIARLPLEIKNKLYQFMALDRIQSTALNQLANRLNDKYRSATRLAARSIANNPRVSISAQEQEDLDRLIDKQDKNKQCFLKFLTSKKLCELFIQRCIDGTDFWLGFDEHKPNPGLMEALAIINKFNFRVWQKIEGIIQVIYQPAKFNLSSNEYRELYFKGNHFDLLHSSPGIFQSPVIEYESVDDVGVDQQKSFGFRYLSLGRFFGNAAQHPAKGKSNLGTMLHVGASKSVATSSNNPSLLGSIVVKSESSLAGINRDPDNVKSGVSEVHSGFYLPVASGIIEEMVMKNKAEQKLKFRPAMTKAQEREKIQLVELKQGDLSNSPLVKQFSELQEQEQLIAQYDLATPANSPSMLIKCAMIAAALPIYILSGGRDAHSAELPQSNQDASSVSIPPTDGTWSVLKKAIGGDVAAKQEMRNRWPIGAEISDAIIQENEHRKYGAVQFAAGMPQVVFGDLATKMLGADNVVAGIKQMLTNNQETTLLTQGLTSVGEKTGFYQQAEAQHLAVGLNFLATGLSGLPKTSINKLAGLDLTLPKFSALKVSSNVRRTALANSITQTSAKTATIGSRASVLPLFNNQQQQIFRYGAATALGAAVVSADKAIKDTIQQFRRPEEEALPAYIFVPADPMPSSFEFPIHTYEPLTTTFPIPQEHDTVFAGPAPEIKKPIIFSGGIDYRDQQLLDSLNVMESRKKTTEAPPRPHAPNPNHGHISAPKEFRGNQGTLPGFDGSKYVGQTNDKRDKWILNDKTFATWDKRHGVVDLFNKTGQKHLGKYDPHTGNKLKDPKPERTSKPS